MVKENGPYRRKAVCNEKHSGLSKLRKQVNRELREDIEQNRKDIKAISFKINATLCFAIMTLIAIIGDLVGIL